MGWIPANGADAASVGTVGDRRNAGNELVANGLAGRVNWVYPLIMGVIWLFYLGTPLQDAWRHLPPVTRIVGVTAIILFGLCYIVLFLAVRFWRRRGRELSPAFGWTVALGMLALTILAMPAAGASSLTMFVYIAALTMFLLPLRYAAAVLALLIVTAEVLPRVMPGWPHQNFLAFQIFIGGLAGGSFAMVLQRNAQLVAAQREISELAVIEERNRLARDLHDLLGHSLTVVAVKAELASRLIQLAPERAASEIADLERLARQALGDVRATVAGYREGSLAGELASAHAALTAAGIEADVKTGMLDAIPAERQRLFGWVVREGVTNVIRHSTAKHCWIRITTAEVEVSDDGTGPTADPTRVGELVRRAEATAAQRPAADAAVRGHGLAGLRERAEAAGARLSVGRSAHGGFTLRVAV